MSFLLYFARVLSFVNFFYVTRRLPPIGKTVFSFVLAVIVFYVCGSLNFISNITFMFSLIINGFVGYIFAFIISLPFFIIEMNGKIMDTLRGETIGDNLTQSSFIDKTSSLFNFVTISFLTYFICSNGLMLIIKILFNSFEIIPLVGFTTNNLFKNLIYAIEQIFIWLTIVSFPGVLLSLVIDLMFAFPSVAVPSLNIFTLSFPVKSFAITSLYVFFLPTLFTYMIKYFANLVAVFG